MTPTLTLAEPRLSLHAAQRAQQRRISREMLALVLTYGRTVHARGTTFRVIGRKEVERFGPLGVDLRRAEGVHALLAEDGAVITTYRNQDLRKIRPGRRSEKSWH